MDRITRTVQPIHSFSDNLRGLENAATTLRTLSARNEETKILDSLLTGVVGILLVLRAVGEIRTVLKKRR